MDQALRHAYLRAMGVTPWVLRHMDDAESQHQLAPDVGTTPAIEVGSVAAPPAGLPLALDPNPESPVGTMDWEALRSAVAVCQACDLCATRTQTVFGVGNREAPLLVIGEAPGADEDRAGEPFVGRAGQLLNRMLSSIGLPRQQVYIANILKCRPPGNRDPRAEEILRCQPYLYRQIELIGPRVILALGRIAAQSLLGPDQPLARLRGRWFELGPRAIPLRITYHPAYLLRSPDQKARVWEDLTAVVSRLGRET